MRIRPPRFRANRSRASRERSHGNGASTARRLRRMRCSADARGKCKYVKARPEFSYSRCPLPPRHSPRPLLFPLHRAYSMQPLPFHPRAALHPSPLAASNGCMRVHLPAPSRTARAHAHTYTRAGTEARA